jgi:hypothetical protein
VNKVAAYDPQSTDIRHVFDSVLLPTVVQRSKAESLRFVIILDALDECNTDGYFHLLFKELLKILLDPDNWPGVRVKVLFTSRPIQRQMEPFSDNTEYLSVDLDHDQGPETHRETTEDIQRLLRDEMPRLLEATDIEIKMLTSNAGGNFLWAATLLELLRQNDSEFVRADAIYQNALKGSFQKLASGTDSLDRLYTETLQLAFKSPIEYIHSYKIVVGAVLVAKSPLSLESLQCLLRPYLDDGQVKTVVFALRPLLWQGHNEEPQVRTRHASIFDFLIANKDPCFSIDRQKAQQMMTVCCLRLLVDNLHFNMCHLETSHHDNSDLRKRSESSVRDCRKRLEYSCRFWADHLQDCLREPSFISGACRVIHNATLWGAVSNMQKILTIKCLRLRFALAFHFITLEAMSFNIFLLLDYFLRNQATYWLEVLSVLDLVDVATPALGQAKRWIGVCRSLP